MSGTCHSEPLRVRTAKNLLFAGTRRLLGPRGRRLRSARIRLGRSRRLAREINRDTDVLLGAAAIEQYLFYRSIRPELLRVAREAFAARSAFLPPPFIRPQVERNQMRLLRLFAAGRALGLVRVHEELRAAGPAPPSAQFAETLGRVPPRAAIRYLESLPVVEASRWQEFLRLSGEQAFTVSGIEERAALESLRKLIIQSLEAGLTPREFNRMAAELVEEFGLSPSRLRTVWNNNVATAIQRGRDAAFDDPDVASTLTWGVFDAINDPRVRANHVAGDNWAAPREWWLQHPDLMPLLGHNCRCQILWTIAANARRRIAAGELRDLSAEGVPAGFFRDRGF